MPEHYPYRDQDVHAAASLILRELIETNHGIVPTTFRQVWKLVFRYDLECRPVKSRPDFTAELRETRLDEWTIFYNHWDSEATRMRRVIHEMAEFRAVTSFPHLAGLFDGIPGSRTYHYHGGDDPRDVRHCIAICAERLYLRMVAEQRSGG